MPQPYPHVIMRFHCMGSVPIATAAARPGGFGRVNRTFSSVGRYRQNIATVVLLHRRVVKPPAVVLASGRPAVAAELHLPISLSIRWRC
jgi:hypothetical protein